jgi:PhnB protein
MKLVTYLSFNGTCEAAFTFYQSVLGGAIKEMHTYEGSPMAADAPAEWQSKIMHVEYEVDGQTLMGADGMSDAPDDKKQGFMGAIMADSAADAERIFHALSENGTVQMPIQETFWAERFAMWVDQFGTPWSINCEKVMG